MIQETLLKTSIEEEKMVMVIEEVDREWMAPIWKYLTQNILPENPLEARKLRKQASWFTIMRGSLYRRAFSGPYLKCLTKEKGEYVMAEFHEGISGMHNGGRVLAKKVI